MQISIKPMVQVMRIFYPHQERTGHMENQITVSKDANTKPIMHSKTKVFWNTV